MSIEGAEALPGDEEAAAEELADIQSVFNLIDLDRRGHISAAALAQALPATCFFLTLDCNRISDAGAVALAQAGLPSKTEVWLRANQIGDAGAAALAEAGLACDWSSASGCAPLPAGK